MLTIDNQFLVSSFGGRKFVYLSEVNSLGGKNLFLGKCMLCMTGVIILIMCIFGILYLKRVRNQDIYST